MTVWMLTEGPLVLKSGIEQTAPPRSRRRSSVFEPVVGSDVTSTWVKRVALLLMMMPVPAEASKLVNPSAVSYCAMLCGICISFACAMESTAEHGASNNDEG